MPECIFLSGTLVFVIVIVGFLHSLKQEKNSVFLLVF